MTQDNLEGYSKTEWYVFRASDMPDEAKPDSEDLYFAERIQRECSTSNEEDNHRKADKIVIELLRELGMHDTAAAFENVEKFYSHWNAGG